MPRGLVVASHNLMGARQLGGLVARYQALQRRVGLHLMCAQECYLPGEEAERAIADALGGWEHRSTTCIHGLSLVFDPRRLRLVTYERVALPRPAWVDPIARRTLLDGRPLPIDAQFARFETDDGPLHVVHVHLDTVGGTVHRRRQIAWVADKLARDGWSERLVLCGDTNAFAFRRKTQLETLDRVLAPLAARGLHRGAYTGMTHRFARQDEPGVFNRLFRALGRVGIDVPGCYDVVATDRFTAQRGRVDVPESDHDLVFAELRLDRSTA